MGINLGPVRLVKDLNGQVNITGDGINVAQRVMSFSEPGQLLVSRSFYEVASRLSNDYAELFTHEGSRTDKHVREHEVYSVTVDSRADRRIATESRRQTLGSADRQSPADTLLTTPSFNENIANQPAQVFEAGANLIISGYSRSSVQDALNKLADSGARVISPITQVNNKWMATCEHPNVPVSACKVETLGHRRIVTGPTREAVSAKVEELVQFGAILVRDIQSANGVWIAICEADGSVR